MMIIKRMSGFWFIVYETVLLLLFLWLLTPCVCLCVGWMPCVFQVIRVSPMLEREGLSREDTCSDSVTSGRGIFMFILFIMLNVDSWVLDFVNFVLNYYSWDFEKHVNPLSDELFMRKFIFMRLDILIILCDNCFGVESVTSKVTPRLIWIAFLGPSNVMSSSLWNILPFK